jgi:hypothetical protein
MICHLSQLTTKVPSGCFYRVFTKACNGDDFSFVVSVRISSDTDRYGFPTDAVIGIQTTGTADRHYRMKGGLQTLKQLLSRYIILDHTYCPITLNADAVVDEIARSQGLHRKPAKRTPGKWFCEFLPTCFVRPPSMRDIMTMGIPQRSLMSGICWYGSMWFALLMNRRLRKIVLGTAVDEQVRKKLSDILHHPQIAEEIRCHLFEQYGIGDDPKQAPELDGQNGYNQLQIMCEKIGVPLVTFMQTGTSKPTLRQNSSNSRERCIGGLRVLNNTTCPPLSFEADGYDFFLVSCLTGNPSCGHQSAISMCGDDEDWWAVYDPDLVTINTGPFCFRVEGGHTVDTHGSWWSNIQYVNAITKPSPSASFCDMNVTARSPSALLANINGDDSRDHGNSVLHIDWLYEGRKRK